MANSVLGPDARSAFLLGVGRTLASSLDYEATVRAIVDLAVPQLADLCVLHVLDEGEPRLVAIAADTEERRLAAHATMAARPVTLGDERRGTGFVLRTGEPLAVFDIPRDQLLTAARDEEERRAFEHLDVRSTVCVPLWARERIIGALSLSMAGGARRYTADDVAVAEDLVSRAAIALDNAVLYRAERAARAEAERARVLMEAQGEAMLDGIFFQGADGRTAWYNQRLLELWNVDSAVPQKLTLEERLQAVMHKVANPETFFAAAKAMEEEPERSMRLDALSTDGRVFDCHTAPVRAPDGARLGRVWSYRDVTDQRATEAALARARRELSEREKLSLVGTLVSGVAHEIRTPLTYVSNHAHLLDRLAREAQRTGGEVPLEALVESAREINEGVDRMNRLVVELRRLVRREEATPGSCDVDAAARAATELFVATRRGRVTVQHAWGGAGRAALDDVPLQQVVLNLLENAADASPAGGTVRVETRLTPKGPQVAVRDEGPGMTPDVVDRMWEPFFTTKKEGTGLGLSIVRRVVESSGGSVAVETAPGKGTTFVVTFPGEPS